MNLNSKYFDSIRIAPRKERGLEGAASARQKFGEPAPQRCEWEGCRAAGLHRAPKATARQPNVPEDKPYRWLCADHIREFNQNYDFFQDMTDAEIAAFQRDAITGHRPTWGLGVNAAPGYGADWRQGAGHTGRGRPFHDTFGFFEDAARSRPEEPPQPSRRKPRTLERQALQTLGLDETATLNEIKSRYKELVKKHHPDANGGDRSAEERLRKVIQAYDYLRKSGFC
ncbi:MAG TPA: J domain-containing protein [Parvibaculum sp.]|uniref:J domain-containing protein n=1 Tax=Parvibaculum sp. TaxID=2024848 RepID=UPI002C534054|nr:J domain-containing protein [Parvibaculum sp.]HMM15692.1 J domain-containing protein [Parvibaculum sp.]